MSSARDSIGSKKVEKVLVRDEGRKVPHDVDSKRRPVPLVQDEPRGVSSHFPPLDAALSNVCERHRPAYFMPGGIIYRVEAQVRVDRHTSVYRYDGAFMKFNRIFRNTDTIRIMVIVSDQISKSNVGPTCAVEDSIS